MPITVVQGSPQDIWVPITDVTVIYVGSIVGVDKTAPGEGVIGLPDAVGAANVTNNDVPYGVVIGTNLKTPVWNSTYKCYSIPSTTAADPHDGAAREYVGVEGPYPKGDQIAMAKISLITPSTVLKAPFFVAEVGVPLTERTVTAGDAAGTGCVVSASDFTPIAYPMQTVYFRTGANAGTYRMVDQASATALEWDTATVNDTASGDVLVMAPVRTHGFSTVMFDDVSATFIDIDAPVYNATHRYVINVVRLDLRETGKEYVEFMFDASHFGHAVVSDT
jgi:hypothetical protein